MNDLIKNSEGEYLTPHQIHLLIISNGKILEEKENEQEYILQVMVEGNEKPLEARVAKELVPGVDETTIKSMLGDAIFREYTVKYHSSKRLEKQQE